MGFNIVNSVLVRYTEEANVTEVIVPAGVTLIGMCAFSFCTNIKKVVSKRSISTRKENHCQM